MNNNKSNKTMKEGTLVTLTKQALAGHYVKFMYGGCELFPVAVLTDQKRELVAYPLLFKNEFGNLYQFSEYGSEKGVDIDLELTACPSPFNWTIGTTFRTFGGDKCIVVDNMTNVIKKAGLLANKKVVGGEYICLKMAIHKDVFSEEEEILSYSLCNYNSDGTTISGSDYDIRIK